MKDKRFKIKNENLFFALIIFLMILTSCFFYLEKTYLFFKSLLKKNKNEFPGN